MIDLRFVEKLLELLNSSNAAAIGISKAGGFDNAGPVTYQVAPTAMPAASANPAPPAPPAPQAVVHGATGAGEAGPAEPQPVQPEPSTQLLDIKSPMVGTFYAQPEPGAEPYVRLGSRIDPGQTLCIIEAMKIMNPIDAEVSGVITEISVQDAQPVEFGQVLFRVDPNG
jgi:acetyl-CoA carboxylase biotin carboxyl carrier protein